MTVQAACETAKPAILFIHGGGLTSGDKATDTLSKSLATDFAKMEYVSFDVNYRLRDNPTDGKWYNDDCLEIVFDLSDNNVAEQLLKWVIGAEGKDFSVLADKSNATVAMTKTGNTRNYEIAIDLNKIDPSIRISKDTIVLEDDKTMGLSIAYNDCENKKREHQIGWTAGKSSDRTTLGNLIFR